MLAADLVSYRQLLTVAVGLSLHFRLEFSTPWEWRGEEQAERRVKLINRSPLPRVSAYQKRVYDKQYLLSKASHHTGKYVF
jgi:hypothetical protein